MTQKKEENEMDNLFYHIKQAFYSIRRENKRLDKKIVHSLKETQSVYDLLSDNIEDLENQLKQQKKDFESSINEFRENYENEVYSIDKFLSQKYSNTAQFKVGQVVFFVRGDYLKKGTITNFVKRQSAWKYKFGFFYDILDIDGYRHGEVPERYTSFHYKNLKFKEIQEGINLNS